MKGSCDPKRVSEVFAAAMPNDRTPPGEALSLLASAFASIYLSVYDGLATSTLPSEAVRMRAIEAFRARTLEHLTSLTQIVRSANPTVLAEAMRDVAGIAIYDKEHGETLITGAQRARTEKP